MTRLYSKIVFRNIKGMDGDFRLQRVTCVHGGNGSGKSAILEAMQLAATGSCSLGKRKSALLLSGAAGLATAISLSDTVSTQLSTTGGKFSMSHEGPDLQGGMPISVDEFWGLTDEQRLTLVGGAESLSGLSEKMNSISSEIKQLREQAKTPPPQAPGLYDGPPQQELEEKMHLIRNHIAEHQKAPKGPEELQAISEKIADKELQLKNLQEFSLDQVEQSLQTLDAFERNQNGRPRQSTLEEWLAAFQKEAFWIQENCNADGVRELLKVISSIRLVGPIRETLPPEVAAICNSDTVSKARERLEALVKQATTSQAAKAVIQSELNELIRQKNELQIRLNRRLSDESYQSLVMQLDSLKNQYAQCLEWESFESRQGEWAVQRSQVAMNLSLAQDRLAQATKEKSEITARLKQQVEDVANAMLTTVGLERLEISIGGTDTRPSMKVMVKGVDIAALADSERLLYGLCLLSAIQDQSSADCPVLLARCAEMDLKTYERIASALSLRKKGNVLLEHWAAPHEDYYTIQPGHAIAV